MYQYQELSSGEDYIRRLILEPGKGDAPLVGRLEQIKLSRAHDLNPFKTISYVWGSDNKNQTITVDGKRLDITKSLRDSLRQTRDAYEPVALWADGICINQQDDKEKSRQVVLMGQIYEKSQRVLICLGLDEEDRQSASDVAGLVTEVETLIEEVFEDPNFSWDWDDFPYPFDDDPLLHDHRWDSWGQLLAQPWFTRGWVVQEAALGPDGLVLWAGKEIRLESILRVYLFHQRRVSALNPLLHFRSLALLSHMFSAQHPKEARTFWPWEERHAMEPIPTLEILDNARDLLLTDPKDRIYAFMALGTMDKAMSAVRPNYGKDVSHLDVYRDFAINYLENTSNLDILHLVEHEEEENSLLSVAVADAHIRSLPSWVPRWDHIDGSIPWIDRTLREITCIDCSQKNSRGSLISIVDGSPTLQVRAIVLDSVKYVSETIEDYRYETGIEEDYDDDTHERAVTQVVSLWRNLAPNLEKHPGPYLGISSFAFLVALNLGRLEGDWEEFYQSMHEFARLLESDQPSHPADAHVQDPAARKISLSICETRNRRFVLLGRGYYGVAPKNTREGDLCTIIFGTRTPFILRRVPGKQDQYSVVGPVFVLSKRVRPSNGAPLRLAEDKFCDDWKDWDLQTEDITLV